MFHMATGVPGPTQGHDSGQRSPEAEQEGTSHVSDRTRELCSVQGVWELCLKHSHGSPK